MGSLYSPSSPQVVAAGEIGTPFFAQVTFRTPYDVYANHAHGP